MLSYNIQDEGGRKGLLIITGEQKNLVTIIILLFEIVNLSI
jgi:hypothetical protein